MDWLNKIDWANMPTSTPNAPLIAQRLDTLLRATSLTLNLHNNRSLDDMAIIAVLLEGKTVTFVGPHAEEDAERIKAQIERMLEDLKGDENV